ncbi:hypothetical protein [Salinadaptatus halalkaliphilus]|uniref:hypothetical protein n=1 Tax=Salinadaptatus halalkaliphilus TaxID=2419781 RepID=UPI001FE4B904|nr:hypothetical protein [Salinadaptatus halalkaliphilus]
MSTLVQTDLNFDVIEDEIECLVDLLGGEQFATVISELLERLDQNDGIQTPLDDVAREYYQRYMNGYELRVRLDEDTATSVSELASTIDVSETEIERRYDYLEQYGFVERTSAGIRDTAKHD